MSMRASTWPPALAGAKTLADIMELQAAFWRKQFGVLTAQAEEVRALSTKVTTDAAEQIKSQMAAVRTERRRRIKVALGFSDEFHSWF